MNKKRSALAMLSVMVFAINSLSANLIKPNGCKGPNLCSSYPILDSCGWQFDVGLLYQQMRVSGADVATAVIASNEDVLPLHAEDYNTYTNKNIRFGFDVDAGLRIGAGYYFENDDWFLSAGFEWLSSTSSYKAEQNVPIFFRPTEDQAVLGSFGSSTPLFFQQVGASLDVDYFLLDVVLAKGSYFSDSFTFEPFAGIQSTWVSYKTEKHFSDDSAGTLAALAEGSSWASLTNVHFWGVGPEIGLNSSYYMMGGWSIYSTMNVAVLLGQTTLSNMNGFINLPSQDPTYNYTEDENNVLCPAARTILGLQYDRDTYCDRQHLRLRLGFDARYIFNQFPVVNYLPQYIFSAQPSHSVSTPYFQENNSFGMVGLILDVAYDF